MKSKKVFDASEDFGEASIKGKKKHKLAPVKKQKSNRNQFINELDEFDEDFEMVVDDEFDEEDEDL